MSRVEDLAMAAWIELHGGEPTEPLREKGGALDPDAWCMEAAEAIVADKPLPWLYSNTAGFGEDFRAKVEHRAENVDA